MRRGPSSRSTVRFTRGPAAATPCRVRRRIRRVAARVVECGSSRPPPSLRHGMGHTPGLRLGQDPPPRTTHHPVPVIPRRTEQIHTHLTTWLDMGTPDKGPKNGATMPEPPDQFTIELGRRYARGWRRSLCPTAELLSGSLTDSPPMAQPCLFPWPVISVRDCGTCVLARSASRIGWRLGTELSC